MKLTPEEIDAHLGETLKHFRVKAKMTQQEVADALNISRPHLCKHENGQFGMPFSRFILLCEVVGTTPGQFLRRLPS